MQRNLEVWRREFKNRNPWKEEWKDKTLLQHWDEKKVFERVNGNRFGILIDFQYLAWSAGRLLQAPELSLSKADVKEALRPRFPFLASELKHYPWPSAPTSLCSGLHSPDLSFTAYLSAFPWPTNAQGCLPYHDLDSLQIGGWKLGTAMLSQAALGNIPPCWTHSSVFFLLS